ncbi:PP2C family protein-serine/threonine phosphatase [Thermodesulfobacteriota bacterium]
MGRRRKQNEDSFLVDDEYGLYVVADGLGGHQAGEVASRLVVDAIRSWIVNPPAGEGIEFARKPAKGLSEKGRDLLLGILQANRMVRTASEGDGSLRGMGSTVSAVTLHGSTLVAANVGDSPIYLARGGSIEMVSVLHTVAAEFNAVDPGNGRSLGPEFHHVLTRAVGVEETVLPDIREMESREKDVLVLCSDGLSDKVAPGEILEFVSKFRPQEACTSLVATANQRGGDDNITVIVLKILGV